MEKPSVARFDSAGVDVVSVTVDESSMPVFGEISPTPDVILGSTVGSPEEQFGKVRAVVALSDGGVAVLDEQAGEVRLFDSTGAYRRTLGSKGQGPGEFRTPTALRVLAGDTLAVFDPGPKRVTRFSLHGDSLRVTTLGDTRALISEGRFSLDGGLVGQSHWDSPEASPLGPDPALIRDTVVLSFYDVDGEVVDTIDVMPGKEEVVHIQMRPGAVSVRKRAPAFARTSLFAPAPEGLWAAVNDRFELRFYELPPGALRRIVRVSGLERSASSEVGDSILSRVLAMAETAAERAWLRTWFELSPRLEAQPAYDVLEVGGGGRVWVRAWSPFGTAERWWVFEPDGSPAGFVDAPGGLRITSIQCGAVLGVEQDELGVDYAVRYSFQGPAPC